MNLGLIIDVDGTTRTFPVEKSSKPDSDPNYDTIRNAVGGWIEAVRLADDLLLYCNEEGKLERLPMNYMATNLVARIRPGWGDWLVGSVVLVGDDGSPNSAGIPDRWIKALTELGLWPIRD